MSDTNEPISAVLAEMRAARNAASDMTLVPTGWLTQWADRVEAAVKRELEIARDLGRIDRESDNMARAADALEKAFAPGNAAAMRAALECIVGCCEWCHADACEKVCRPELTSESIHAALAALAAPARNCDRPECADVESAWATYCAETNRADCKGFARWLFAEAEGGSHA